MSFIAITYGYNQYSMFNTYVSTFPLLDNIVSTCLDDIINLLNSKLPLWEEKINNYNTEEEQVKKSIKKLETDKLSSDEKGNESSKPKDGLSSYNESSNNKKNNSNNNVKANPKDAKNNKNVKNEVVVEEVTSNNLLSEEISSNQAKLQVITSNKERIIAKKQMLLEILEKYTTLDKAELKIDLVDIYGERAFALCKGDSYANSFLADKQCYELHKILYNKEDKSEIGTEPMKFDGFCVRTFDEDSKWEEFEKSNKNNPKKIPPKKK